jgi:putative restriction endonuclease
MATVAARNWYFEAGRVWSELAAHAAARTTCNYRDLAPFISTNPLSVRRALAPIQDFCIAEQLPPLTALVVQVGKNKPGKGFIAWDIGDVQQAQRRVFAFDWRSVPNPFASLSQDEDPGRLAGLLVAHPTRSLEIYAKVPSRGIAQVVFRRAMLRAYDAQCAFCGLSFVDALEAAHIWPWAKATPEERLDPRNGVLACANHHRLFDSHLLTFDASYKIVYFDPLSLEGPYSDSDRLAGIAIHRRSILLPKDKRLHPDPVLVARRNADGEWGDLDDY